jgi:hypothetical protein
MCRLVSLALVAVATLSCSTTPSAPSVPDFSGTWTGTATVVSSSGGLCHESNQKLVGLTFDYELTVKQKGTTWMETQGICVSTWSVGPDTFTVTQDHATCPLLRAILGCGDGINDGAPLRYTEFGHSTVSASVVGNTATGTITATDNEYSSASSSTVVDTETFIYSFRITR